MTNSNTAQVFAALQNDPTYQRLMRRKEKLAQNMRHAEWSGTAEQRTTACLAFTRAVVRLCKYEDAAIAAAR